MASAQTLVCFALKEEAAPFRKLLGDLAEAEISHWQEYDYVLVNQDLDQTLGKIDSILKAERLKRVRQEGLAGFVGSL